MHNRQAVLAWSTSAAEEARFRRILTGVLLFCLAISLAMPWLPVPKSDPSKTEELPPRYAKLLLEQQPAPPPPVAIPKPIETPTTPVETESAKPKTAEARKPDAAKIDAARRKASGVGLLALGKELSALADTSSINSSIGGKKIATAPANTAAASVDTQILTADTGRRSVNVAPESHAPSVGSTRLEDNQRQITQQLLNAGSGKAPAKGGTDKPRGNALRGDENVAVVMDQHKSALHSIYDRARRSNPGLKGKIVLILTIMPSGQVANVVIKSSELNAPELEASLVARIRQFDFGKREGGPLTVTVPVEFMPS